MIANLVGFFRHQIGSSIKINYNLPEPQRSDAFDILSHMLRIPSAGSAPAPSLRSGLTCLRYLYMCRISQGDDALVC